MRYNIVSLVGGINMDIEFSSKEEPYRRVKPALRTKKNELIKLGTKNIREVDIWNFLIKTKWKNGSNLCLFDIVNDITQVDKEEINQYLIKAHQPKENNINLEII